MVVCLFAAPHNSFFWLNTCSHLNKMLAVHVPGTSPAFRFRFFIFYRDSTLLMVRLRHKKNKKKHLPFGKG